MTAPRGSWLRRHGESLLAPIVAAGLYGALIYSAGAGAIAGGIAALFFIAVLMLYLGLRRMRVHAAASRLASIGDPEALLALVERELPRRFLTGSRRPLHIFAAIAHNLKEDWPRARRALDDAGGELGDAAPRGWQLRWAAADIHERTARGDAAGARRSHRTWVEPIRGRDAELVAAECEARILLVEGEVARARERVAPLVKDVRLGAGVRAQLHALLARTALAAGDSTAAADHASTARKLAPKCPIVGP